MDGLCRFSSCGVIRARTGECERLDAHPRACTIPCSVRKRLSLSILIPITFWEFGTLSIYSISGSETGATWDLGRTFCTMAHVRRQLGDFLSGHMRKIVICLIYAVLYGYSAEGNKLSAFVEQRDP
jgi:hypothetical protein